MLSLSLSLFVSFLVSFLFVCFFLLLFLFFCFLFVCLFLLLFPFLFLSYLFVSFFFCFLVSFSLEVAILTANLWTFSRFSFIDKENSGFTLEITYPYPWGKNLIMFSCMFIISQNASNLNINAKKLHNQ